MPKINITTPFNYQSGGVTKHFAKGEQDVPQDVADHAEARGFSPKPAAEVAGPAATEPAADATSAKGSKKP